MVERARLDAQQKRFPASLTARDPLQQPLSKYTPAPGGPAEIETAGTGQKLRPLCHGHGQDSTTHGKQKMAVSITSSCHSACIGLHLSTGKGGEVQGHIIAQRLSSPAAEGEAHSNAGHSLRACRRRRRWSRMSPALDSTRRHMRCWCRRDLRAEVRYLGDDHSGYNALRLISVANQGRSASRPGLAKELIADNGYDWMCKTCHHERQLTYRTKPNQLPTVVPSCMRLQRAWRWPSCSSWDHIEAGRTANARPVRLRHARPVAAFSAADVYDARSACSRSFHLDHI